ncbi:AsmA family protein [Pelagerythrobacter sp.]|uniref:AsmA family protein n=1 Tax=Pelagerythrobacter sp. TaxID=2800702 RepID=UPI0035B08A46
MAIAPTLDRSRDYARRAWTPRWLADRPRPLRIAVRTVAIALLALFAVWLILFVTKGRFLKGPFEGIASSALEREVSVGGDFQLYFAPIDVKFLAEDVRISNPDWAEADQFFTARLIDTRIRIFPLIFGQRKMKWLTLDQGAVALERDEDGTRNTWTFGDPDTPGEPLEIPQIERGTVSGSRLVYRDPPLQLFADIGFETVQAKDTRFDSDIRFTGEGTMRERPFTLAGNLLSPNETIAGGSNRLALRAEGSGTVLDVSGTLPAATQLEGSDLRFGVRGYDIANLFDFLGVAVPSTRAYRFTSALTYDGSEWKFTGLKGVFGESDLAGSLRVGSPNGRLKLIADLATQSLDIVDVGPFIGYDPRRLDDMGKAGAIRQVNGRPRVLPDATLRIDALRRFDAELRYKVAKVRAESFPLSNIDLTLGLDDSLLTMEPLTANVAGGTITADIALNAREPVVRTAYDIRLSPTNMGRLLASFGTEQSGTTGSVSARVQLAGTGDSLRQSLAHSSGRIAFIIPAGTFWTRNIQLAELDLGTFAQKMFEDELKEPVQVNCGLIAFTVRDGVAAADPILIDTKKNVMLGRGGFSFRSEAIDMAVRADAKTFSLFSGQSPVGVKGYFAAPAIDPISGDLVGRAGAGIGIAAVASPVAGLLAFVDPGDAKAAACGPVLAGASAKAQRTEDGEARDDVGRGTTAKSEDGEQSDEDKDGQRKKFLGIF